MNIRNSIRCSVVIVFVFLLAGCGGGGGGGGTPSGSSLTISGVAAAGAPLAGTVYLKDSSSPAKSTYAAIGADGSFSLDLSGMTAPFILKGVGTVNGTDFTLYSIAVAGGRANINPLTNMAVILANGNLDPAALYTTPSPATLRSVAANLPQAIATVQTALQPTLAKFGAADLDFIADPFTADHQGLDLMLDMVGISVANGNVTVVDRQADNTVQMTVSGFAAGSIDLVDSPVTTAGAVCILPDSSKVALNGTEQFTAVVVGRTDQRVTWGVSEADGGTISTNGLYHAPASSGTYHVTATSVADPSRSATATVTVAAQNVVYITQSGAGTYLVQANLTNVAGIDLTINYDATYLASPQVTQGALVSGSMMAYNPNVPGTLRVAIVSATSISGSGTLCTISFTKLKESAPPPLTLQAALIGSDAQQIDTTPVQSDSDSTTTTTDTTPAPSAPQTSSPVPPSP